MSRGSLVARARVLAQQKEQLARPRELRRVAEAAASRVERRPELRVVGVEHVGARHRRGRRPARRSVCSRSTIDDAELLDLVALLAPDARDLLQHLDEPRPPPPRRRRKVRSRRRTARSDGVSHTLIGHPPDAGRRLHEGHVDAIDVRPLFAIDLDRDEVAIQDLGHLRVLEALVLHHVAPVAGRVARSTGRSACLSRRALSNASSPQGYQSTGLSLCWRR